MPYLPPPLHFHCPACHWSKTVTPTSDVLRPGVDHFSACPQCNHTPLEVKAASGLAGGVAQLASVLEKVFRR